MSIVIYFFKKIRITLSGRYYVHSNTVQIVGGFGKIVNLFCC